MLAELAKEKQLTDKYQQEIAAAGTQRSYYAKWTCEVRKVTFLLSCGGRLLLLQHCAPGHAQNAVSCLSILQCCIHALPQVLVQGLGHVWH